MESLYEKNGLVFWTAGEIRLRQAFADHFIAAVCSDLRSQNAAFQFFQVEASQLMPETCINEQYRQDDNAYVLNDDQKLALRPETTYGSYVYAKHLLAHHKAKMPLCVYQHGKSFRKEQNFPLSKLRLKEFYQLEFQCIYSPTTKADYSESLIYSVKEAISQMIGQCYVEPSDRLPAYSEWTQDIVCDFSKMEVCSISLRKDFPDAKVLEVAIGTDRCVFNFFQKP